MCALSDPYRFLIPFTRPRMVLLCFFPLSRKPSPTGRFADRRNGKLSRKTLVPGKLLKTRSFGLGPYIRAERQGKAKYECDEPEVKEVGSVAYPLRTSSNQPLYPHARSDLIDATKRLKRPSFIIPIGRSNHSFQHRGVAAFRRFWILINKKKRTRFLQAA